MEYWDTRFANVKKRYPEDVMTVNAAEKLIAFYDNSTSHAHVFRLIVYENGQHNVKVLAESDDVFNFYVHADNSADKESSRRKYVLFTHKIHA